MTFDRVYELSPIHDSVQKSAYALRQIRRWQITAEIDKLKASKPISLVRIGSGFILLCILWYASVHYLLR